MITELRRVVVGAAGHPDVASTIVATIARVADGGRSSVLRAHVAEPEFAGRVKAWLALMPKTRRADWLADRLAEDAGAVWGGVATDPPGPIALPGAVRRQLLARMEALTEEVRNADDDEPRPDAYAEALLDELAAIGARYEPLALRLATRKIPDGDGTGGARLFPAALEHRRIAAPARLVKFGERALDLRWEV